MKRLLGLLLVMGIVGCGGNHSGEGTANPTVPESHLPVSSEAKKKQNPATTSLAEPAPASVPKTAPVSVNANASTATATASSTPASDVPDGELSLLEVTVTTPIAGLTLREANQGDIGLQLQLKNNGSKKVTLWPYLSVEIVDARGKAAPRSMNLGRFGFRATPSVLEGIPFVSLAPGHTHEIEVNLKEYRFAPKVITGWQFVKHGRYDITLNYHYDRSMVVMDYGKGCRNLDRADAPWNLALETQEVRYVTLLVKK